MQLQNMRNNKITSVFLFLSRFSAAHLAMRVLLCLFGLMAMASCQKSRTDVIKYGEQPIQYGALYYRAESKGNICLLYK